jgi:hypothetical protein
MLRIELATRTHPGSLGFDVYGNNACFMTFNDRNKARNNQSDKKVFS